MAKINLTITWTTTNLTAQQIDCILGAGTVARVKAMPNAAGHCAGRAAGAWDANECEHFAAYRSLSKVVGDANAESAWIDG